MERETQRAPAEANTVVLPGWATRLALVTAGVGAAWVGATWPGAAPAVAVAVGLAAAVGAGGERHPAAAAAWAAGGSVAWLAVPWLRATNGDPEGTLVSVGVAAAITAGSYHAWQRAQDLGGARVTGEVARAKLLRSNREFEAARTRAEAAHGKLAAVVDGLSEGLVAINAEGRVEIANPAMAELLDLGVVTPGTPFEDVLPSELVALVRASRERSEAQSIELSLPGGRTASAWASPIRVASAGREGAIWGTAVLARDVTLEVHLDRIKRDFAATVSHEMRTPLTSLIGFTHLVSTHLDRKVFPRLDAEDAALAKATATIRANLAVMETEGRRLSALIDDVLDLSKLESDQVAWNREPCTPAELVAAAVDATREQLTARPEIGLVVDAPDDLPLIDGDRARLQRVLVNLLRNALKFTDAGTVSISARRVSEGVEFAVTDTGVGIRPSDHGAVFEKFRQVGDVLTDRPQGTGLGLPIAREIVRHHGGRIWVESALGQGARFVFVVPTG